MNLRILRQRLKFTRTQLATLIDVSAQSIVRWEIHPPIGPARIFLRALDMASTHADFPSDPQQLLHQSRAELWSMIFRLALEQEQESR